MTVNFPGGGTPANNTQHDTGNGVGYIYDSGIGAWRFDPAAATGGTTANAMNSGNPSDWYMVLPNGTTLHTIPAGPTATGYWEIYFLQGRTVSNNSLVANHAGTDSVPVLFAPGDIAQTTDDGTITPRRAALIWRAT